MGLVVVRNDDKIVTEQEIAIVKLFATGFQTAKIAKKIEIDRRTLEAKIGRLKDSYKAKTIAQLVYMFCKLGLIK